MVGLSEAAIGGLDLLEIGVSFDLEHFQRVHLIAASAAVAGASPAIMFGVGEAVGVAPLAGLALRRFLRRQPLEIVPIPVVFGGVALAEIPAVGLVRRLRRRAVSRLIAAMTIATAHLGRFPLRAIAAPARKSPVQ
jgi:hypothetical protein